MTSLSLTMTLNMGSVIPLLHFFARLKESKNNCIGRGESLHRCNKAGYTHVFNMLLPMKIHLIHTILLVSKHYWQANLAIRKTYWVQDYLKYHMLELLKKLRKEFRVWRGKLRITDAVSYLRSWIFRYWQESYGYAGLKQNMQQGEFIWKY